MALPTKKQIRDKLVALSTDPASSDALKKLAAKLAEGTTVAGVTPATIKSRINTFLSQADADVDLKTLQRACKWSKDNVSEFTAPQLSTLKARLVALSTSGTAPDGVNAYLEQLIDRYESIGHSKATALDKARTYMTQDAGDIDATIAERLLGKVLEHWEDLADE